MLLIPRNGAPEKFYSRFRGLIHMDRCICQPRSVIHADMEVFLTRLSPFYLTGPCFSMANPINLAEALYIHMEHVP